MEANRTLAAIMFTDMVGYTALMQENEELAKKLRDRHREILQDKIRAHKGKTLQYYGDGTLSIFDSSIEAISCAVEMQEEFLKDPKVPLRIGIHTGDIVYDDEGIYGHGVNLASRIESMGVSGAVLISEKVHDDIKNHPEFTVKSLGEYEFKNVDEPVEVYAVSNGKTLLPEAEEIKSQKGSLKKRSVAVLPFVNMSSDEDNEYFSDGITEEILNALAKMDDLMVTSRTSSFAFKGKNIDIRKIGKDLNVESVLEGSVRKHGNKVRITAQLIKTSDGYHIFSQSYDRNLDDIFQVQDEISAKIARELRENLIPNDKKMPAKSNISVKNIEAYNLYLKGWYHYNKWTPENLNLAISYFKDSIKLAQSYALPYTGLATAYSFLGSIGHMPIKEAAKKANAAAKKSLDLNPDLMRAHLAMAEVKLYFDWDFKESEKHFIKAKELNAGNAEFHHQYAGFMLITGQYDKALYHAEMAVQLDPLSLVVRNSYAGLLNLLKEYDKSIQQFDKILDEDASFRSAIQGKAFVYMAKENYEIAIKYFKEYQKLTNSPLKGLTGLAFVYARMGNTKKSKELLEKTYLRQEQEEGTNLTIDLVIIYAGLRDFDKVFELLDKAYEQKLTGLLYMFHNPIWGEAADDPRYEAFLEKIGLAKFIPSGEHS